MSTTFWINDVTQLTQQITTVWPRNTMTLEAKLNAVSRLVIWMVILGFMGTGNGKLFFVGVITLAIIVSMYYIRKRELVEKFTSRKGDPSHQDKEVYITNPATLSKVLKKEFHPTTQKNPFGNVLLTDIGDHPDRKAAAPSFNVDVHTDITKAVKKQTQMLHPDMTNTTKQLYGDLKDNYDLDNSLMQFYSTANTRVTNDQGAYGQWLYGNMPSGKSSGPDGAFARVQDNYRYILI